KADVYDDLLQARYVVDVRQTKLLLELVANALAVLSTETCGSCRLFGCSCHYLISLPVLLKTRVFAPFSSSLYPTRVGFLLVVSTIATLLTQIGLVISTMPPCGCARFGLTCFLMMFTPSTVTLFSAGWVATILPVLPLSLPMRTITVSPFCSLIL